MISSAVGVFIHTVVTDANYLNDFRSSKWLHTSVVMTSSKCSFVVPLSLMSICVCLLSQLFKGKFFYCVGFDVKNITNKSDCLAANYRWVHHKYNFDNLGQVQERKKLIVLKLFIMDARNSRKWRTQMQTLEAELMQSNNINYTLTQKGKAYRWVRQPRVKTRRCPTQVNKSNGAKAENLQSNIQKHRSTDVWNKVTRYNNELAKKEGSTQT